jgi:hypothetical protein
VELSSFFVFASDFKFVKLSTILREVFMEGSPVDIEQPQSLEDVIAGLRGFGIEENEEILTFVGKDGKAVRLRITNLPTDDEIKALIVCDEYKGYAWVQRIRVEVLSHSISWINGFDIRSLTGADRFIVDPTDGVKKDVQVVLRNILMGWGEQLLTTLWKIAMVHSDKIEKRYQADFPDSTIMTDAERRFMDTVIKELEDQGKNVIQDTVQKVFESEAPEE